MGEGEVANHNMQSGYSGINERLAKARSSLNQPSMSCMSTEERQKRSVSSFATKDLPPSGCFRQLSTKYGYEEHLPLCFYSWEAYAQSEVGKGAYPLAQQGMTRLICYRSFRLGWLLRIHRSLQSLQRPYEEVARFR